MVFYEVLCIIISGQLLDVNCQYMYKCNMEIMKEKAFLFGHCWLGDGAKMKPLPLLDMLVMYSSMLPAVMSIYDCTGPWVDSGKKDAGHSLKINLINLFHQKCWLAHSSFIQPLTSKKWDSLSVSNSLWLFFSQRWIYLFAIFIELSWLGSMKVYVVMQFFHLKHILTKR